MGALLFHPEFYKAAVANSRLPRQSHGQDLVERAVDGMADGSVVRGVVECGECWRLQGKLMLVVGEMDKNVDPASTMQVADRLMKANKDFDLLYVPGGGHGAGGRYGQRKLMDFFVRNLLGQETPSWNEEAVPSDSASQGSPGDK